MTCVIDEDLAQGSQVVLDDEVRRARMRRGWSRGTSAEPGHAVDDDSALYVAVRLAARRAAVPTAEPTAAYTEHHRSVKA